MRRLQNFVNVLPVKYLVETSQNFVAFSEYMNFTRNLLNELSRENAVDSKYDCIFKNDFTQLFNFPVKIAFCSFFSF